MAVAFGQLLMVVIVLGVPACIRVVFLEGAQVFLQMVVIALVLAHDGAVDLIVMDFALFLSVRVEFLPLDELGLDDFLYALVPFGFVFVETLIDVAYLLLHDLLVALVQSLQRASLVSVLLLGELCEKGFVDFLQLLDVHFGIL